MDTVDWQRRLRENVARVRADIAAACGRVGRRPETVRLVGVTKYVSVAVLRELVAAGVPDIGESRVQQLVARAAECGPARFGWPELPEEDAGPAVARWHMIGHLQRNKVKQLLSHSRIVHSLDSPRLAATIAQQAQNLHVPVDVLVEVNVSGEASKEGVGPEDLPALVEAVREQPAVRLRGLMTMAPLNPDPAASRPTFARLRELLERLRQTGAVGPECVHLSMGMSQDYVVAVEEGATLVRIGSVLFEGLASTDPRSA